VYVCIEKKSGFYVSNIRVLQPNIRHDTQLVDLIEVERLNIDNNNWMLTIARPNNTKKNEMRRRRKKNEEDEKKQTLCRIYARKRTRAKTRNIEVVLLLFFSFTISSCCLSDDRHQQY